MPASSKTMVFSRLSRLLKSPLRAFSLKHSFEREIFFICALGVSAFIYTALFSFNPFDHSLISASIPKAEPRNLAGAIGAAVSGFAIYFFGLASLLLPIPLLIIASLYLKRIPEAVAKSRVIGGALALLSLMAAASLVMPAMEFKGVKFSSGGSIGGWLGKVLTHYLGAGGSHIALATMFVAGCMMTSRTTMIVPAYLWLKKAMGEWRKESSRRQAIPVDSKTTKTPPLEASPSVAAFRQEPSVIEDDSGVEIAQPLGDEFHPTIVTPMLVAPEITRNDPTPLSTRMKSPTGAPKGNYVAPPTSIFLTNQRSGSAVEHKASEFEAVGALLVKTFASYGVRGAIVGYQPGPVVTVYEYQPDAGVKQARVLGLVDDVARALKVDSIFINHIQGKSALGVQVPNSRRENVYLGDILNSDSFKNAKSPLTFAMGKSLSGQCISADLASMPHLLAAGATGSGKSVAINALLCSIIMKSSPDDVRMILVDPKMLELSVYDGIPHLLMPVITEPDRASLALKWAANEMDRRYKIMQHAQVRNISGFNEFWAKATLGRKTEIRDIVGDPGIDKLPYILLVIDELADLMSTSKSDVEMSIQRLAQKARASGIHLVLATQRPSVDIITGVIKANLPCRVAFQVVSKHDSNTILGQHGADKLLGKGDMLFQKPGSNRLERIQGAFISDEEVLNLAATVKASAKAEYDTSVMDWISDELSRQQDDGDGGEFSIDLSEDETANKAITIAQTHGVVSASFLQRHLSIGYNKAARIVEWMESQGLVDKANGSKPRKWLGATTGKVTA